MASGSPSSPTGTAEDAEFGFHRPDFFKEDLAGTVAFHKRHIFLCYKGPGDWTSEAETETEAPESDRLPHLLAAAIKARESALKMSTKLTICEGAESSLGDVLIFPDMIRYRGMSHFSVGSFVEEVLVQDSEWTRRSPEPIVGSYVFVCADGVKDQRCGVCGPALITRFSEEIQAKGLSGHVFAHVCSDTEGHQFAGNVIIFSSNGRGHVTGHWYGYVAPDDVPVLMDKHIGEGVIVDHLWRGQLGMTAQEQKAAFVLAMSTNKLLIPPGFNGDTPLLLPLVHGFRTAGQLKNAVDKTKQWLTSRMAAGLLANAPVFCVDTRRIRDANYKVSGAVSVVNNQGVNITLTDHLYTRRISMEPLPERNPHKAPVQVGDMAIVRRDVGGKRWRMRRFSIEGNNDFHILQWKPMMSDDEYDAKKTTSKRKDVADEFSIVKAVKAIENLKEMETDDKGIAIMIVKDPENQVILRTIKGRDLLMSWLRVEIEERKLKQRGGVGP